MSAARGMKDKAASPRHLFAGANALPHAGPDQELYKAFGRHTCVCGSHDLIAIEPGGDAVRAEIGMLLAPERPARAWCAKCWMQRFGGRS